MQTFLSHFSILRPAALVGAALLMNGCLSFTTTSQPAVRTEPTTVVTKTETVYVTENGARVRRVVRVDATGRRYYDENGRTIYVTHYEY